MPAEYMIMSLPPWIRYKVDNMLISMLIPATLSAKAQKKYFDKVIELDFGPMAIEGIRGPDGPVKVEVFGQVD